MTTNILSHESVFAMLDYFDDVLMDNIEDFQRHFDIPLYDILAIGYSGGVVEIRHALALEDEGVFDFRETRIETVRFIQWVTTVEANTKKEKH